MRHTRTCVITLVIAALFLFVASPVLAQPMGGGLMAKDVFTPIAKGYDFIRQGKYEAAKYEFGIAVKRDRHNPFALNNLAVLEEREGHLNEALANLKDATTHAAAYKNKVSQTCFVGGGCLAVKPMAAAASQSQIAPVIQENITKLEAKIAATKTPPPPVSPPPMSPAPKPKK